MAVELIVVDEAAVDTGDESALVGEAAVSAGGETVELSELA